MDLTLRPVTAEDERFLFEVYASTRADELEAWGWNREQQEHFLRLQFTAQSGAYGEQYPNADRYIILLDGKAIGRFYFIRYETKIVLLDLALLPEYRGRGFGGELLQRVLDESARDNKTCHLQVLKTNRAQQLYERLGYVKTGESGMYFEMVWQPQNLKGD